MNYILNGLNQLASCSFDLSYGKINELLFYDTK